MEYLLGIDLGGSSVKAVTVTPGGQVLTRENREFSPHEELDWAKQVERMVGDLQKHHNHPPARIGLAAPGLAAKDGLSIAYMPGRLHGLENLNWTQYLRAKNPIPVLNDAHAALLGELWLGAAKGAQNAIMLTLGTGVGGAAIVDGRLLKGHIGRAGHLGHACLNPDGPRDATGMPGSLEMAIGNCTIQERTKGRYRRTEDLIRAYEQEDELATKYWLISIQALGASIASFINILDPEIVILGGGIARAGKSLFEPLEKFLRSMEWQPGGHTVPVIPAALEEFAGAIGAARNSNGMERAA